MNNQNLQGQAVFSLDAEAGYFRREGVDVMAFDDIYPSGHQSGVSIIMHGKRLVTNGDVRFEQTPGQWQPTPKQKDRTLDAASGSIRTSLCYPDPDQHLRGFNPLLYPDLHLVYAVTAVASGSSINVCVSLEQPIPEDFAGKACFNLELFPTELFGRTWIMDDTQGIFPRQPNGPTLTQKSNYTRSGHLADPSARANAARLADLPSQDAFREGTHYSPIIADDIIAEPYACGHHFTMCPEDDLMRVSFACEDTLLKLYDGRMNHNNGWFVLSAALPAGRTGDVLHLTITPNAVPGWQSAPVIQVSQVGYHPDQPKMAVIELDRKAAGYPLQLQLVRITADGPEDCGSLDARDWGNFLRYHYLRADFSNVREPGLYQIRFGDTTSAIFRIGSDIYDRGVWQPVVEYFLPVQMCHMRVQEKYRVWHDLCHMDDATMADLNWNHIDGYAQGSSTLTKYKPGDHVPGLNQGGWHDAGDLDLRVESQSGEAYHLSIAYDEFHAQLDTTTIDQDRHLVEIHQPDGRNDIQQQIEHGLLAVVGGYKALGRLYRGIITGNLRDYCLLGDSAAMTDGIPDGRDDRYVFTEDNPTRELMVAAHLAAASHAMKGFNDELSADALAIAEELFEKTDLLRGQKGPADAMASDVQADVAQEETPAGAVPEASNEWAFLSKIHAAAELLRVTGDDRYRIFLQKALPFTIGHFDQAGWIVCRALSAMNDDEYTTAIRAAARDYQEQYARECAETPYGIPYRPYIWGAGWDIEKMGVRYYFLHKAFPDLFPKDPVFHALDFMLGCHPGSNTASFASGVGANSVTTAYCVERADWSYIRGGVVSGSALIRPDFPELPDFPFLWQQTEYVLGGGSSNYLLLVLAVQALLKG